MAVAKDIGKVVTPTGEFSDRARRGRPLRVALAVGGALLFIACTFKPVVQHDGIGYFAYLHSIFVDHDLDLSDEYAAARTARIPGYLPFEPTATGRVPDFFPVGPALLSAPTYLLALLLRPGGEPQFGWPFTLAYVLASLFCGLLALALSYRLAFAVTNSRQAAAVA
jgi:hypothetical protein